MLEMDKLWVIGSLEAQRHQIRFQAAMALDDIGHAHVVAVNDKQQIAARFIPLVLPSGGGANRFIPGGWGDCLGRHRRLTGRNHQKFTGTDIGDKRAIADRSNREHVVIQYLYPFALSLS